MTDTVLTVDPKYRDFSKSLRIGLGLAIKLTRARTTVQLAVDELSAQLRTDYGPWFSAEAKENDAGDVDVLLKSMVASPECCHVATIRFSDAGFPASVIWARTYLHCANASDVYEGIWTALGRVEVGEYLLRQMPNLIDRPTDDSDVPDSVTEYDD
ncbi:MAG: hypothetical protein FWD57_05265 [Polyangiaceae bacterium]|nr:hypothetical protein [Polyangiaceae bacterium]